MRFAMLFAPFVVAQLLAAGEAPAQAPERWDCFANLPLRPDSTIALPEPTGPHTVGTVAYRWIDEDRPETVSADPHDLRQVIAQVWYPATPMADPAYAPYVPELEAMVAALTVHTDSIPRRIGRDIAEYAGVRTHALTGPEVDQRAESPRYPVAIFSPGGNMSRHWYTALMQELASHGYVAISLSHPFVGWDVFPRIGFARSIDWGLDAEDYATARAAENRMADVLAADVALVLDRLAALDADDPGGRFTGRLDLGRVAILGHSRGGATVARSCAAIEAIDACVVMDNIGTEREKETGLPRPQLTVRRADWSAGRVGRLRSYLGRNAVESWDVAIEGAGHNTFTDLPIVDVGNWPTPIDPRRGHRVVSDLVLAFLGTHLGDDAPRAVATAADTIPEATATAVVASDSRASDRAVGGTELPRAEPESLGWSVEGLEHADRVADSIGTATYVVVEDSTVVWTRGDVTHAYRAHSMRKSLFDALVGIQVARGAIDPGASLVELGIDDAVALSPDEKRARLEDLLTSRSGVYRRAAHESEAWDAIRPARGSYPPGKRFFYSNWDFNVAGIAWTRRSGRNPFHAFAVEVAGPLGMRDFRPRHGSWRYDLDRSGHPAYVFRTSARDLARFGLLYLNEGRWDGRQLVPAAWVRASTRPRSAVTHPRTGEELAGVGYGRLWWTARGSEGGPFGVDLGPGSFWASGTGNQLLAVSPSRGLVIVHLVDTDRGDDPVDGDELARLIETILEARRDGTHASPGASVD